MFASCVADVLPPDEDAGVQSNSVYTNAVARLAMLAFAHARRMLGEPDEDWTTIANNIYIPFDSALQYHPEYDGYVKGQCLRR